MVSILNTFPILSIFLFLIDVANALNNSTNKTSEDGVNVSSIISTTIGALIFGGTALFVISMWICDCKQSGWRCCKDIWNRIKCSCCKKCKLPRKASRIKPRSTDITLSVKKNGTTQPKFQPKRLQSTQQKVPPIGTPPVIIRTQGPTPPPSRSHRRLDRVQSMTLLETKRRREEREHELSRHRAPDDDEKMLVRPHTTKEKRKRRNVLRTVPIVLKAIRRPHRDEIITMPTTIRQNEDEIFVIPASRRQGDNVILYPESPRTVDTSDNDDVVYKYPSNYHHTPGSNLDSRHIERLYDRPEYDLPPPDIYHTHQSMHAQSPPPSYEESVNYSSYPQRPKRWERY